MHLPVPFCHLQAPASNVSPSGFELVQAVLDEVAGRQVAVNNRAGRSNGQVEALLSHVDALLATNGNSLFHPSDEPATAIEPARYCSCSGLKIPWAIVV